MKQIKPHTIFALAMVMFLASCSTQRAYINGNAKGEPTHSQWSHYFFFDLGPDNEINAAKICGGAAKVAEVEQYFSFGNILVSIFPGLGGLIWSPRTANVYCKK